MLLRTSPFLSEYLTFSYYDTFPLFYFFKSTRYYFQFRLKILIFQLKIHSVLLNEWKPASVSQTLRICSCLDIGLWFNKLSVLLAFSNVCDLWATLRNQQWFFWTKAVGWSVMWNISQLCWLTCICVCVGVSSTLALGWVWASVGWQQALQSASWETQAWGAQLSSPGSLWAWSSSWFLLRSWVSTGSSLL